MTQENKETVYFRDRGNYQQHGYTMREIEIFVSTKTIEDLWLTEPLIILAYQKGDTEKPDSEANYYFYSERTEATQRPTAEVFKAITALFAKMDKAYQKIAARGLTLQNGKDVFETRLFKLKEIGAKQIEYNSNEHSYYLS
jgi:hypothetical protein